MNKEYLSDHARVYIDDDGVIQSIQPDSHLNTNLSDTIENYVLDELVYFRYKNHISARAWKKTWCNNKRCRAYRYVYLSVCI